MRATLTSIALFLVVFMARIRPALVEGLGRRRRVLGRRRRRQRVHRDEFTARPQYAIAQSGPRCMTASNALRAR